jgi:integrase
VHFCLSGALTRAVRWRWITVNPLDQAEPPRGSTSDPDPPTSEQAAAILNAAFPDLMWGCFLWLAMTTGTRRGELCALRWDRVDLDRAVLTIRSSIAQKNTRTWEKDTKTHQQRRVALDADTVSLLRMYQAQCEQNAAAVGVPIAADGRLFSSSVDHSAWLRPFSVSNRYARMCRRLGWDMNLHQLPRYSATELIAAGVDVRTVAGRLGHGGGGSTTLRAYTAWVAEADQRAMNSSSVRMPALPVEPTSPTAALHDLRLVVSPTVRTGGLLPIYGPRSPAEHSPPGLRFQQSRHSARATASPSGPPIAPLPPSPRRAS